MAHDEGDVLLKLARGAIARQLGLSALEVEASMPRLNAPGATFVTLTANGQLRGCIGTLEAYRPLRDDVQHNARAAAFRDPRFLPVTAAEWPQVRVEVSLLSTPEPLPVRDEADLCAKLQPGVDGVIFQAGLRRSTFLPQVWEQLPKPRLFLAHLKEKAGLPADYWGDDVRVWRYGVQKWKEGVE